FYRQLVARLQAAPGVDGAAVAGELPLQGMQNGYVTIDGRSNESTANQLVEWNEVTSDYFRVMGIPLLSGRSLSEADDEAAASALTKILALMQGGASMKASGVKFEVAAVINQTMA